MYNTAGVYVTEELGAVTRTVSRQVSEECGYRGVRMLKSYAGAFTNLAWSLGSHAPMHATCAHARLAARGY